MIILTKEQTSSFRTFIESHETFIIAGHKEPDGDCISCCLGVSYILDHFNKPYTMASQMVDFTKNQILTQAGTAMLAQANSQSQTVLSLLK